VAGRERSSAFDVDATLLVDVEDFRAVPLTASSSLAIRLLASLELGPVVANAGAGRCNLRRREVEREGLDFFALVEGDECECGLLGREADVALMRAWVRGIQDVIEATDLRTLENVTNLIDPAILKQALDNDVLRRTQASNSPPP
jgi:hypothetical protein